MFRTTMETLMVWDIQTGIIIRNDYTRCYEEILFLGDQGAIVLGQSQNSSCIYGVPRNTLLFKSSEFSAYWVHEGIFQFAINFKRHGKHSINIYELKQTSTPPLHKLSSFPIVPQDGKFAFSPVSFHASFSTKKKIIILDVQSSKFLLCTNVTRSYTQLLGQFSPDGQFFAYRPSNHEICVLQNTPTGYVPWSSLRPRLSVYKFLWSPTSKSILCKCSEAILLLCPGNHSSTLSPDRNEPNNLDRRRYLVAYSTDKTHAVTARQGDSIVTVLDCISGTTQAVIDTNMNIKEIKMIANTIYVVNVHKLVSWHLKPGGVVPGTHKTLHIGGNARALALSHDCSHIAGLQAYNIVFLYSIEAQEILKCFEWEWRPIDLWFSPDGQQLWYSYINHQADTIYYIKLDIARDWVNIIDENIGDNISSWANLFSCGYYLEAGTAWVTNSRGSKILWLPPHWRLQYLWGVKWGDNFMALLSCSHPVPIIIEFQPQYSLSHS